MNLSLVLLLLYSVGLLALGLVIGRQVNGASDFFVAGRALGPGLLFSTLLAANIGAGSTVGATGARHTAMAWPPGGGWEAPRSGSIILALLDRPARCAGLAARHDLRTVGDYLELRYGASVRGMVALLLWFGSLAILAGQLIAIVARSCRSSRAPRNGWAARLAAP